MIFLFLGNPKYPNADLCNMDCRQFLDDDLRDDIQCVYLIYHETWMFKNTTGEPNGFYPWDGWKNHCKGEAEYLSTFDQHCPQQKGELWFIF